MKKTICTVAIFVLIISILYVPVLADDLDEEEISQNELKEEILNVSTNAEDLPKINSRAALVYDRTSEKVIFEKNGYTKRAMASTTKIMTAIVVLENSKLTDIIQVSKKAGRNRWVKTRIKKR